MDHPEYIRDFLDSDDENDIEAIKNSKNNIVTIKSGKNIVVKYRFERCICCSKVFTCICRNQLNIEKSERYCTKDNSNYPRSLKNDNSDYSHVCSKDCYDKINELDEIEEGRCEFCGYREHNCHCGCGYGKY